MYKNIFLFNDGASQKKAKVPTITPGKNNLFRKSNARAIWTAP